jgi:hypothetical protein
VLILLGLSRAIALVRRSTGASWRDAIGAFFVWQSTSLVVARASVLALFAKKATFLRTPKTSERASRWRALRANWAETILALLGAAGIVGALTKTSTLSGPLLAGLLFVPALGMAAAPFNSWAARRAALPDWLRERRSTEYRREHHAFAAGLAAGGMIAIGAVAALAIALMLTGRYIGSSLVRPLQSPAATTSAPAPSATKTPRASPTSATPKVSPTSVTPTVSPLRPPLLSPVAQRERAAGKHGADGERGSRLGDGADRQDLVEQYLLVAGEVGDGGLDEEVVGPGDRVAGDDLGDGEQRLLDERGRLAGVPLDLKPDEHGQAEAGPGPVDLGVVPGDDAARL